MLIDFKLLLKIDSGSVSVQDRHNCVNTVISTDSRQQTLEFKSSVPNQLTFKITNFVHDAGVVELQSLSLGGLTLDNSILQQICVFYPEDSDQSMITTRWWKNGVVVIDFFAGDWIQYHLLYRNKINVR